jgi:2,4-dienoyl-CoA reductase (NADPH2)
VVNVPVIVVVRIGDPNFARQVLVEERADLIAMGRALIANPFLPSVMPILN